MSRSRDSQVLSIVMTDKTFVKARVGAEMLWVGKCIYCNTKLVVWLDGRTAATIEHIRPRALGGDDDPRNTALACSGCNNEKGRRQDGKKQHDESRTTRYLKLRTDRWRDSPS